jgi:cell pole-organizing protein PopZ
MSFLKDALNYAKEKVSDAAEAVSDAAETVKDKVVEADLLDKAKDIGGNLYERSKDAAEAMRDKAVSTGEAIQTSVQLHTPELQAKMNAITESGREALKDISEKIKNTTGQK